jgi:hypothetical protein
MKRPFMRSAPTRFAALLLAGLIVSVSSASDARPARTEFPQAAQPQLAATGAQRVYVTFGRGSEVWAARSDDGARHFADPVRVADVPKLMLGMRRGPRIAAHGDRVTITVIAHELLAFSSTDAGQTWSGPVVINDTPTSAREGLHDLAAGPDGTLFVTWLDLRRGKTELWSAESADAGKSWNSNTLVYRSSDQSICECCHPTARFDAAGTLAVMWRNSIAGDRDAWLATRARGATQFAPAAKLGAGTWTLKACPMDGGSILSLGNGRFASVWQRAGEIFFCPVDGPEINLGAGKQPVAFLEAGQPIVLWQQGPDLVSRRPGDTPAPAPVARQARFPVVLSLPDHRGVVLAYEQGPAKTPDVIIERR